MRQTRRRSRIAITTLAIATFTFGSSAFLVAVASAKGPADHRNELSTAGSRAIAIAKRQVARERKARELFATLGLERGRIVVVRSGAAKRGSKVAGLKGVRVVGRGGEKTRDVVGAKTRFTIIQLDDQGRIRFRDARATKRGGALKIIDDRTGASESGIASEGEEVGVPIGNYLETIEFGSPGEVLVVTVDEEHSRDLVPNEWVEVGGRSQDCEASQTSQAAGLFESRCATSGTPSRSPGPRGEHYGRGVGYAGKTYGRGAGFPWKAGDKAFDLNPAKNRCEKEHGAGGCEKDGAIYYPKCKKGYEKTGCCTCRADSKAVCEEKEGKSCEMCLALAYPECDEGYEALGCNVCEYQP